MLKIYIKLLPLQGVTNERALTQGVASLALGYVLLPFQGVHYRRHLLNPKLLFFTVFSLLFAKLQAVCAWCTLVNAMKSQVKSLS